MSETELILDAIGAVRDDIKGINSRLDDGAARMQRFDLGLHELVLRETERNGQIKRLTAWREAVELREAHEREALISAESFVAGENAVKARARSKAEAIWDRAEKPVITGAMLLMFGAGIRIAAFLLGGPW